MNTDGKCLSKSSKLTTRYKLIIYIYQIEKIIKYNIIIVCLDSIVNRKSRTEIYETYDN